MAETAVSLALETIRDLLLEEVRFLSGVETQVKEVQQELQRMKCFLEDVDRRKYDETRVLNYVKEIRRLAYRIEDVVETYSIEVPQKKRRSFRDVLKRFACIFREASSLHKVGAEIEDIKTGIGNLTASLETYGIKAALEMEKTDARTESKKWLRQTFAHEIEEDFVGMKGDLSQLVALLLDDKRHHRIISIWGMGGIGKTTLARKIYHHDVIRRGFQAFAWVCITQECKPKDVLQDVLRQLHTTTEKKAEVLSMTDRELVELLYKVQKEKKCLVVVDDIWKEEDWEGIRPAFPIVETDGKILITTRKENVAKIGFPYSLKFLSKDESWELLQRKAFSKKELKGLRIEPNLVEHVGREMVQKCGYLPLAISVIGGILSERDSLDAWEMVNKDMDSYLKRGKSNDGDGAIQQVLALSYDDLPYRLKPCFLYLGQYPEDKEIDVEEVCLLWMAEGIVSSKDKGRHETLMDVAQRYFGELASRSMVRVQVDLISMQFKSCHLHDLMRELCLEKCGEEEFFHTMDFRGGKQQSLSSPTISVSVRRLAIYEHCSSTNSIVQESTEKLRCLLFHTWDIDTTLSQEMNNLWKLKLLRVVKFEKMNLCSPMVPDVLGKLIRLRFLGMKCCLMEEFPSSVYNLPLLQTLDLRGSYSEPYTLEIPNVPWKLKRLKHLYLPELYHIKGGTGKLQLQGLDELETLSGFHCGESEMSIFNELKNLQCLLDASVHGNESLSEIIDYLHIKTLHLISMRIMDCYLNSGEGFILLRKLLTCQTICELDVTGVTISKFPKYESNFCLSLKILRLLYCTIEEDPMEVLENFPKLRCLHLCQRSFLGKEMIFHANGFPQLKELCLFDLPNWEKWTVEQGAMPCLSILSLSRCAKLEMFPDGLRFVSTLQTLTIHRMPEEFLQRVRQGGADFDNIRHVNSVYIYDD